MALFIRILWILPLIFWSVLLLPTGLLLRQITSDHLTGELGLILCVGLCGASLLLSPHRKPVLITVTDLLAAGYMAYMTIQATVLRPHPVPGILVLKFLSVGTMYVAVRTMDSRQRRCGLALVGAFALLESLFILLQRGGMLASRHLLFNHTGSFFNPGLAGGFLACGLCILGYFFLRTSNRVRKIALAAGALPLVYALFLTDSRAGWLAALAGGGYGLWMRYGRAVPGGKGLSGKRLGIWSIGILALWVGLLGLYRYKTDSADGRLFIWRNTLAMVREKPLSGHGFGTLREIYPRYQARFFRAHPDSSRALVAASPFHPFNEYLSVLAAHGVIGFLFLAGILVSVFCRPTPGPQPSCRSVLATYCVFAFFHTPPEIIECCSFFSSWWLPIPVNRF
ncbi:MAG: O-antigen ligase family protein [Rikenellaceae bacterium]|nr:O-antigen ligase family protein [Rikenellaceae bacterium]